MNLVKKIGSAVLVLLILLNVLGYYGIFMGLDYQNNRAMQEKLDAGAYDDADQLLIKLPLAIPYFEGSAAFERSDGRFEHGGQVYRKVSQRYSQDTLYMVCVKDHTGTRIGHAMKSYVKTFSDKPADSQHSSKTTLTLIKEYLIRPTDLECRTSGWHYGLSAAYIGVAFIPSFLVSINHPPE